ncbi:MAG: M28 family metallopeptidase [Bacteroidota bacterium]|nr:M28 family metallopeptidase [Bacteroidota bacterium]
MKSLCLIAILFAAFYSCKENKGTSNPAISEETLRTHISVLASDSFEGRKPFTYGERKTLEHLESEAKKLGLQPGNGSSFLQDVPLVEIHGHASDTLQLAGPTSLSLTLGDQFVAFTQRAVDSVVVENSEVVFCGYGVIAPEYNWNDYAGLDVKGKTVIVLVNDPGLGSDDSTFFKGNTMTYYGRWTYKYEEAARQGAAAIFIVHETSMAGYPYNVVQGAGSGAKLNLRNIGYEPCKVQGWLSLNAAKEIFSTANMDLQPVMQAARKPGFKPIPLPYKANLSIRNDVKEDVSKNVVAIIPGTESPDEYIIYSAHWDHFGIGAVINNDSIYNGAEDNASGSAGLLAIAEAMMKNGPMKRTIVFLWVTAEEQGLLGSAYYAAHPIFPPEKTVANLNLDAMHTFGLTNDFSIIGFGQSELEDIAKKYIEQQGRYLLPDQQPEKGSFFRSDHFNFAKIGIPSFYGKGSADHKEKGKEYATEQLKTYNTERYHQPADEYNESFEVSGMLQDLEIYLQMGEELGNGTLWPKWKVGSEFKSMREK